MTTNDRINGYADTIMTAIYADMRAGLVPFDVGSFSALHNYRDANMYVLTALGEADTYIAESETDAHYRLVNSVMDEVNRRLAPWCETCGSPVENGMCGCWCHLADALQRYLGMDHDAAALMARNLWEQDADRMFVWAAGYADTHAVETYPDTRRFASAELREQDARDYPHDEPCPVCGRRQWTDETAQETCQSCGYVISNEKM